MVQHRIWEHSCNQQERIIVSTALYTYSQEEKRNGREHQQKRSHPERQDAEVFPQWLRR